jgi:small conductance mechanosensitive channel
MSIIDWSNLLTISMCAGGDPDKSGNVSTSTNAAGLIWKTMVTVWQSFLERLPLLIAGLIFLALTWVVTYIFNKSAFRILSRFDLKQSQRTLITRLITITIWIVGILISALIIFPDLTPSKALAGLGIGSIAIGFAFKDIFENFFAGLLILWRFPFEPGDYIKCQDV